MTASTRTSSNNKKSVRICESNNITYPSDGLSLSERSPLHYSARELSQMKRDLLVSIGRRNMRSASFHGRGLESYIDGSYEHYQERREDYVMGVLELYDALQDTYSMDPQEDPVSLFAANKSKADRKEALRKGKQDEIEAGKVYKADKMISKKTTSSRGGRTKIFMASLVQGFRPKRAQSFARGA